MDKLLSFLNGKKTYVVAIALGICAALQALGIAIPEYVWVLLGALGLGAVRAGITKQ